MKLIFLVLALCSSNLVYAQQLEAVPESRLGHPISSQQFSCIQKCDDQGRMCAMTNIDSPLCQPAKENCRIKCVGEKAVKEGFYVNESSTRYKNQNDGAPEADERHRDRNLQKR